MPKVPYSYEANGKLVTGNGSLLPIFSLMPSLTVLGKNPETVATLFRHTTMAEFCNSVSALPLLGHLILKQISAKKVQSRFFNFGSKISKILEVQCRRDYPVFN